MEEEKFYTLLTDIGKAKVANSIGFGTKINFTKMKVGDGNGTYYNPSEDQTELKNVVWEGAINHVEIDQDNPNYINIEVMLPANVGGFYIREYGAYDDEDNLIGICKCPESYKPKVTNGGAKELLLILTLCVVNTESIELKIDPTIIFAKKQEIETLRTEVITQLNALTQDSYPIVEATGTNAYVGASTRIKSVGKGTRCTLIVSADATENCSLNLNDKGAVNIRNSYGEIVDYLKSNIPYNLYHNGSDFILQGEGGENRGAPEITLNCGGSYNILKGHYSGGIVKVNSMATQMANNGVTLTSASQLISGIKAYSKTGQLLTGIATIESLGGIKQATGTFTITTSSPSSTYTSSSGNSVSLKTTTLNIGFTPSTILIINSDDNVQQYITIYSESLNYLRVINTYDKTTYRIPKDQITINNTSKLPVAKNADYIWLAFE